MKKKTNKGITLIALVITIIVLLILAGVSIATLTGENGILNQAQKAKEETKIATEEEQKQLAIAEAAMNMKETEYQGIKIPAGMTPTRIEGESTIDEGLVAIDKNGNEWVWIEVPESAMSELDMNSEDEIGSSEATRRLNTYDLAGNIFEWSLSIQTNEYGWFPVITHSSGFAWTSNHGLGQKFILLVLCKS